MKDEIKEINIKMPGQILDYVDTKEHLIELFNYITNLQEENEKLKKFKNFYREKFISNFCAKNRAIEYIKENCIDDEFYINLTNKEKHIIQALDILQGEYKDED